MKARYRIMSCNDGYYLQERGFLGMLWEDIETDGIFTVVYKNLAEAEQALLEHKKSQRPHRCVKEVF